VPRRGIVAALVVLAVLAGPVGVMARLQAALDGPSPAQDHAEVIAHGVTGMPAEQVAWRVVVDSAEPLEVAEPQERALGFALADADAIVVNDLTDGSQTRLAAGEASFTGNGVTQQRASLSDQTVSYYRLALVAAEAANDAGGDDLIFAGDRFAAPDGNRDLDLVRDVLQRDEATSLDDSGYPVLILVTAGELEVSTGGEPQTLGAGAAAEFRGDLDLTGAAQGETAFVAAVIGPDVPAPPRFFGTVALGVYACEQGVTADDLENPADPTATGCVPVTADFDVALRTGADEEIALADATEREDGLYLWEGLTFGDYEIGQPSELPAGYGDLALYDVDGNALGTGELTIDRQTPDVRVNFYLFASATGSVTVHVANCPPGMTAETLAGDFCEPATGGYDLAIELFEGDGQGTALTLADATADAGGYTWSGFELPASGEARTLGIHEPTLPEGFDGYVVVGAEGPLEYVEDGAGPAFFAFDLSLEAPATELTVYNFQPGEATTGEVSLTAYLCPTADATNDECLAGGTYALDDVMIVAPGEASALTLGNAGADGDTLRWGDLPLGTYSFNLSDVVISGASVDRILGVTGGEEGQFSFELTADAPTVDLQVLVVAEGDAPPADDAGDADNDGLTDDEEAELGTDPNLDNTDGDCATDGVEVDAETDPLDPDDAPACE
ncbi:MAG: hypothetical protein QOJ59_2919, partial [Thermomicrobiales bacterium]|nr:hypothetical protein [Thermomicrobiales bacterium]